MNEIGMMVLLIIGLFIGLPVILLLARDRFTRPSREEIDEHSRKFIERLKHPDFPAVEKHFGHPLPACVQALYNDHTELMRGDFEIVPSPDTPPDLRWYVAYYQPADAQTVADTWPGRENYFPFADDGCGNTYVIDPKQDDPPVLFHDHETGDLSPVCNRFTEFLKYPRLELKS